MPIKNIRYVITKYSKQFFINTAIIVILWQLFYLKKGSI